MVMQWLGCGRIDGMAGMPWRGTCQRQRVVCVWMTQVVCLALCGVWWVGGSLQATTVKLEVVAACLHVLAAAPPSACVLPALDLMLRAYGDCMVHACGLQRRNTHQLVCVVRALLRRLARRGALASGWFTCAMVCSARLALFCSVVAELRLCITCCSRLGWSAAKPVH